MEQRLFRLAWAAAILWAIAGVYYCRQLDEQYEFAKLQASWGSVAERQLKADCAAHIHTSVVDCYLNKRDEQYGKVAEQNLGLLGDKMNASGKWTFWPPFGILSAFFLGRWLIAGRWRAISKH